MFNEFKEYNNPESLDYDLRSKTNKELAINKDSVSQKEKYVRQIIDMVGFLEDGEWANYGITEEEYISPTKETVEKIKSHLKKEEANYRIK